MTILEAHQRTKAVLIEHHVAPDEAHATARILLDALTAAAHAHLTRPAQVLDPAQHSAWDNALRDLKRARPLPYILGTREFFGLKFRCDERALIPRPETELLVERTLAHAAAQASTRPLRIADLGTGSGCIAIAIAVHLPAAEIYATDLSPRALELARENASTHSVAHRVHFVEGETGKWASPLSPFNELFDVIVSNPPYIAPRDIAGLLPGVREFEPRLALDGGEDGLDCYREIAAQCRELLRPDGVLICELGAGQFDAAREIFEARSWNVADAIFDLQGIARVLAARHHANNLFGND